MFKVDFKFDLAGILNQDADEDLQKLINKPKSNVKAIDRAMSKIYLQLIKDKWEWKIIIGQHRYKNIGS